ncbi:ABC transporter family substrate-binding protein [Streptacidiphilus sp. 4-A2]|nr:ABC transporter family substrate-binding protein [Streptacidiphilus sp. 4-A2]
MSRRYLKMATATALSAGLVLSASACSSSASKSSSQPTAAPVATLNEINPQPVSALKQGGTLNWPEDQWSTQWNNLNASSQNEESIQQTMAALLPSLFLSTADNKLTPNPDYLTSVTNGLVGGKQVTTYNINPKAHWSDGTPITWKDFQVNWMVQNGTNPKYSSVANGTGYSQISSVVEGTSPTQVVVTYSQPYSDWQSLFSLLYPGEEMDTPAKFNNAYTNAIPVTAGPFKLGSLNQTTKVVTVVRDPKWWGTSPVLDSINFRSMDDSAMPGAFASGEIDLEDIGPDVAEYKQAIQVKGTSIRVAGGPNLRQLLLNGDSPELTSASVRQAVFLAINRAAIGEADLSGMPWPIKPLNNHFLVNNASGYQDNSAGLGNFDPSKASALLAQAGYTKKGAYLQKDGKTLELKLAIPSGVPTATTEAQAMTAMEAAVGIKVDTQVDDTNTFFNDVNAGQFDMTIFSGIGAIPFFPLTNSQASFQSPVKGNIGQNYSRIGTPQIDALMVKAGTEIDHTAYISDINAADAQLWQLAVNLPLYQRPELEATNPKLANWGAFGFATTNYSTIGWMK